MQEPYSMDTEEEEKRSPDIFDRIMTLPLLCVFRPFYTKYKEVLLYLLFGALTTAVDFITFFLMNEVANIDEHLSNITAWVLAVTFAFVTNRHYVFSAHSHTFLDVVTEILRFAGSRVATLLFAEGALLVFVTWLSYDALIVKAASAVIVVILNYVFSKLFVFRRKNNGQ